MEVTAMSNTQMTQTTIDVLERLSGWTDRFKFEFNQGGVTELAEDGVMWLTDGGVRIKTLEHMDIDGEVFVRDPQ